MSYKHLEVELLDPDKLVSVNNLKPVTDPIFFKRDNIPTEEGLLSNEIFGNTIYERSNIFAYIDLGGYFINPLIYKTLCKLNLKFKDIVHGTKYFKIVNGDIVEDEDGDTGLVWLKENFNKIKFKSTASEKRDINIEFINKNRNLIFMNKLIVLPAYYRDINTSGGHTSVGGINKIYDLILLSVRALKETVDYGLDISNSVRGRLQDQITGAYDFFTKGSDMTTGIVSESAGLSKKRGFVKRAWHAKTSDYGSRLIISSADLAYDRIDEMEVDLDYCGLPLSAACSEMLTFVIFNVKRFFENEFSTSKYPYIAKDGTIKYVTVKDPNLAFSDEVIKHEIERFIKGYSNRFIPIEVPNEEGKKIYMKFKGRQSSVYDKDEIESDKTGIINRRLTWCDVFYMAAVESAKGKHALLTRFPLNDYFGQVPNRIHVISTIKTESVIIDGQLYKHYPYIREELIGANTSSMFKDTLQISNLYLKGLEGDFDGDQLSSKIAYTIESNEELEKFMQSKANYIDLSGICLRETTNEAIQSIYSLTRVIDSSKLSDPVF